MPRNLYLDEMVTEDELADACSELDNAIWFTSLLTRVDGVVLMNPEFDVTGFGAEITASEAPRRIRLASDERATGRASKPLEYEHYGTRHRSVMRYCAKVAGSVGFVVSQDGDVRAITHYRGAVVLWDNIQLQLDFA